MDLSAYKTKFLEAAREHINNFSNNLSAFSQNPSDTQTLEELHRAIHSLGSQCYAMDYKKTGEFARVIEGYFYNVKNGQEFNPDLLPYLNDAIKDIENSLESIETHSTEADLEEKESKLKEKIN